MDKCGIIACHIFDEHRTSVEPSTKPLKEELLFGWKIKMAANSDPYGKWTVVAYDLEGTDLNESQFQLSQLLTFKFIAVKN